MTPKYPLTVRFDDGSVEVLNTPEEVAGTLEWFDTDDPTDSVTDTHGSVTDAQGRAVRLKVERLEIVTCEISDSAQEQPAPRKRVAA